MKKFNLIKIVVIAIIAALGIGLFSACNKDNDNANAVTPENDVFTKWECVTTRGNKVTLDLYKDKYFTTLSDTTPMLCTGLLFGNNVWVEYQMNQDTMFLTKIGDFVIEPSGGSPGWFIDKPSENIMIMEYLGLIVGIVEITYEFKRVE
ncbi:MAG: hypothetical protein PHP31_03380 [Lentimicrobiaceae bacterium]|nr:hypothetical protein [Lentimicrobiaceae bacterium]